MTTEAPERHDAIRWNVMATLQKWNDPEARAAGALPDAIEEYEGNALLNEGITRLLNLLVGGGGTSYSATNARIGVGNGTAAVAATQTGLQGASTLYKALDSAPTVSGQQVQFAATFGDTEANFDWNEWSVDNGATAAENLNRRQVAMGSKSGGTWTLTVTITLS